MTAGPDHNLGDHAGQIVPFVADPGTVDSAFVPAQLVRDTVPSPPAPVELLRPVARPPLERWLLRWGVMPYLLLLDGGACMAASWLTTWQLADVFLVLVTVPLFKFDGLYGSRLTLSALDDSVHVVGRILVAAAIVTTATVATRDPDGADRIIVTAAVFCVLALLLRAMGYAMVRECRRRGAIAHPTLILGAGRVGGQLAAMFLKHPEFGLNPVGFLDRNPLLGLEERPVPLLGGDDELPQTIVEFNVHDVVVAFGSLPESELVEVIRTCDRLKCDIFFIPRLYEVYAVSRGVDQVRGLPLVRLLRSAYRTRAWKAKRVFDVVVAGTALLLLAPLMGALALAVRLEGGPGILFRQVRVGLDNRQFSLLKFRSLRPVDETESATNWNISLDDRLGRVGRFIRASSLDELPQLWNILRGDMSLVGPRPERPHFADNFASLYPRYLDRHRVPAGLSGWAQVNGLRGDTSIEERARYDNHYIENWSIWLDLRIILRTISQVLRRAGG